MRAIGFREGGEINLAVCRIAAFSAVLWGLHFALAEEFTQRLAMVQTGGDMPYPRGLFVLAPKVPPQWLLEWWPITALVSTVLAIVGGGTRIAMPLSVGTHLLLAWFTTSFQATVSHQQNLYHFVGLAMMWSRAGDAISLDQWIGKRTPRGRGAGYWWPVLLGQAAIALLFASACFWKLKISGLEWAFSDNLRNTIVRTWWWYYSAFPDGIAGWIVQREWTYRSVALMNLVCQGMLLSACLLTQKPWWRAAVGLLFVGETLGLGIFMGIWNWPWLLCYAFFVDWEALLLRRPRVRGRINDVAFRKLAVGSGVLAYLTLFCVAAFSSARGQRAYPFTSFPMYCTVIARKPYGEHLPYDEVVRKFERRNAEGEAQLFRLPSYITRKQLHGSADIGYLLDEFERFCPRGSTDELRVEAAWMWIPPYPAPPAPVTVASFRQAWISRDGQRFGAAAHVVKVPQVGPVLELIVFGSERPAVRILYQTLPLPGPSLNLQPLPGEYLEKGGMRFLPALLPKGAYQTILEVTDPTNGEPSLFLGPVWKTSR